MRISINKLRERIKNKIGEKVPYPEEPRTGQPISSVQKFQHRAPCPQNDIDIFVGHWASDLSKVVPGTTSGPTDHFTLDDRPAFAMTALAGSSHPQGLRILELGPLEGGHTYQFEKMGVREIIAVEANVEAFLKCLIVKNLVGLKNAKFLFGDCTEFLKQDTGRYDFIFCCGVLYHMEDPVELISLMAARTDKIFLWTHYFTETSRPDLPTMDVRHGDQIYTYHRLVYESTDKGTFWGGNRPTASLLSREDIFRAFEKNGYNNFIIHRDELEHRGGPCFSVSFWRV